jgi:hypothetical protein
VPTESKNQTRHERKSDRYCQSKVCPEFHSSFFTKTDRYSILHFRLNLTDIQSFIFDHTSTDIPPKFHRRSSAFSSSDKLQHFTTYSFASSPTVQLPQLDHLQFYVFFPSNSSYSTNSTSLAPSLPSSPPHFNFSIRLPLLVPSRHPNSSNGLIQCPCPVQRKYFAGVSVCRTANKY